MYCLSRQLLRKILLSSSVLLAHGISGHLLTFLQFIFNQVLHFIELALILFYFWKDHIFVDSKSSLGLWMEQVDEESQLKEIIEWNNLQDNTGKLIKNVEAPVTHPICKPHFVIIKSVTL